MRYRRLGRLGPDRHEGARIAVLDADPPAEPTVLAKLHAAGTAHLIVLPGSLPTERRACLRSFHVYVGEQAVHPKPIPVPGERDHRRSEIIEPVIHPLRGFRDLPPADDVSGNVDHNARTFTSRSQPRKVLFPKSYIYVWSICAEHRWTTSGEQRRSVGARPSQGQAVERFPR